MPVRLAGLLLPAFTPRRDGDLGIGDTLALKHWIDVAAANGIGFLQLLPLNETGSDDSPYNAISSVALEPLYLSMEPRDVPGLEAADVEVARAELGEILGSDRVNYAAVRKVKRALLEKAWLRFNAGPGDVGFYRFQREDKAWLENYCIYRWLMDQAGGSEAWDYWPEPMRTVEGALAHLEAARAIDAAAVEERLGFYAWVQWLCFVQWRAVRQHADHKGVRLMGDIPIGVSRYSADVFFNRDDFDLGWCGGAPPERMFKYDLFIQQWGQNWGIPLYHWERMEATGFPWWRQRISMLTDVFHIFRIDHVLGFYRIYSFPWQPQRNSEFLDLTEEEAAGITGGPLPGWNPRPDDTADNKAENRHDGDVRLRMVIEAAKGAAVVGEDLGCVPDYVRPHLASLDVAGFRVPHWDADEEGNVIPPEELPECSFATYATHDHESLPAMWENFRTLADDVRADEAERDGAANNLRLMAEFAGIEPDQPYGAEVKRALFKALLDSKSRYAAIMITDLCDLTDRINSPGTVGPHNWSFRLPVSQESIAIAELAKLRPVIQEAGR
ncbi:4-alpha-glucanotransferase [Luteolibacter flavescens]|uniref:4-alpha-glucanotransferase n=1 Tax=Luteolibacter flavescens TaxID=1859460 RepID=A0ABT3FTI6_9BACT|nr:4-alpha-glucanotransferase [Luteolibacter flavescens]MCW1886634.1 4-alpha-glucanotransferase [Luteolibacter flavescens]